MRTNHCTYEDKAVCISDIPSDKWREDCEPEDLACERNRAKINDLQAIKKFHSQLLAVAKAA